MKLLCKIKCHQYFKFGGMTLQKSRCFSDDPTKTFREKGLSEENRYFLKKQQEELIKLRKDIQLLTNFQTKLDKKLEQTENAITNLMKDAEGDAKN